MIEKLQTLVSSDGRFKNMRDALHRYDDGYDWLCHQREALGPLHQLFYDDINDILVMLPL